MRTFGRVETAIWQNWKFHELSDDEKLLWLYIISCPHGNALGCFVLPVGYVASDMRWPFERASKGLSKLFERGRIERDEKTDLTRVVGWFGHNRIENTNVAKGILATITTLPRVNILSNAIKALLEEGGHFVEGLRKSFQRALEELSKTVEPPEPEPEPEPIRKTLSDASHPHPPSGGRRRKAYPANFEQFWQAFPKRGTNTKALAFKAWDKARKTGTDETELQAGASRYAAYVGSTGCESAHVQTWINREGWTASYEPPTGNGHGKPGRTCIATAARNVALRLEQAYQDRERADETEARDNPPRLLPGGR